jgi:hypothetical protein
MSDKEAVKRKVMYLMKETIVGQLRANWGGPSPTESDMPYCYMRLIALHSVSRFDIAQGDTITSLSKKTVKGNMDVEQK